MERWHRFNERENGRVDHVCVETLPDVQRVSLFIEGRSGSPESIWLTYEDAMTLAATLAEAVTEGEEHDAKVGT